jgi:hypothetical protein
MFPIILIISFCVFIRAPSGLFHLGFSTKPLYAFLVSLTHAVCSYHLILCDI